MKARTKKRYKRYYKNLKEVKLYILLKYISILILGAAFSAVPVILSDDAATINSRKDFLLTMSVACICFLILNVIFMRKDYYRLSHRRKYQMVNYIPQGMYLVTNVVCAKLFGDTYLYTYFFGITNLLNYTHHNIDAVISAITFNAVAIGLVRLAPVGMDWIYLEHG